MARGGRVRNANPLEILFESGTLGPLPDRELLARFARRGGEEAELAFAVLAERHARGVFRVCVAILGNEADALDAMQATFLVLARKADRLWVGDSLGPWLIGVARRCALRAKGLAARRRAVEAEAAAVRSPDSSSITDVHAFWAILSEEVERLPARYRSPVVLCDLDGHSYEEAAEHLGCPVGTLKSRLARGRERLRSRLLGRGVGPSLVVFPPLWPGFSMNSAPRVFAEQLAREAVQFASRGVVQSETAAALAEGLLMSMKAQQMIKVATVVVGTMLGGAMVGAYALSGDEPAKGQARPAAAKSKPAPVDLVSLRSRLEREWKAVETLSISTDERFTKPDAKLDYTSYHAKLVIGKGDRRALAFTFHGKDGVATNRVDIRENGKTKYSISSVPGKGDVIGQVVITDQTDTRDRYAGIMSAALWLWMPGGRTLSAHLAAGAKLAVRPDGKGGERVVLVTKNPRMDSGEIVCELDPEHDWAVKRIDIEDHYVWEVTKFRRVDGRWVPESGRVSSVNGKVPAGKDSRVDPSTEFEVLRWDVNREIPDSAFELPEVPEEAVVFDHGELRHLKKK